MKNTLPKITFLAGLIGGSITILFFIILYFFYENPLGSMPKRWDAILYIFLCITTLLYYKTKINNNQLTFTEGIVAISLTNLVITLINCLFLALFLAFISEKPLEMYTFQKLQEVIAQKDKIIQESNLATYQAFVQKTKEMSIQDVILQEFTQKTILGFLMAIVAATAFRK